MWAISLIRNDIFLEVMLIGKQANPILIRHILLLEILIVIAIFKLNIKQKSMR